MKLRTIVIGGAILSIVLGFTLGKTLLADAPAPGSSADPLVSKSYVDKAMEDRIKQLETVVAELSVSSTALQKTINELQAKIDKKTPVKTTPTTPTTPTTGGNTTPVTPTTPTTPPATNPNTPSSSVVGKTAYVIQANNYVNLRRGPSTNDPVVKQVNKGEPMGIMALKDNWYQVKLGDGTTGWVASWLVDVK